MKALLFFAMLRTGRVLAHRKQMSQYAELCKVTAYPTYTEESKQEILQYYRDQSLTPQEWASRERLRLEMEKRATESYQTTAQALDFFRATSGGAR